MPVIKTNREKVMDAAWQMFWRKGFHATSIREIAQEAGLPKGSIYNYFPSKEDLFSAVYRQYARKSESELRQDVLAGTTSPSEIVRRVVDHYTETLSRVGYSYGDPIAARLSELADTHPELARQLVKYQAAWRSVIAQKIWAYATVTRIPALIEHAEELASVLHAALQGVVLQMKAQHSIEPLKEARDTLAQMVDSYVSALATGEVGN